MVQDAVDVLLWCAAFRRHPVYLRARAAGVPEHRIIPVALYWDGVQYTKRDSMNCYYVRNLYTGVQYLSFITRKDEDCQCGCRG